MFEVGKKVIAILNSRCGRIKKGDIFELQGIKKSHCSCPGIMLDIGFKSSPGNWICRDCREPVPNDGIWWKYSFLFAPYDGSLSSITVEELLEEVEGTAGVLL